MMEAIPRDYGQGQFDAFCKKVLKNEARAYLRNMKRQRDRETMFSDLPQHELDKLCTVDRYPSDSLYLALMGTIYISTTSLWPTLLPTCRNRNIAF